MLFRLFFFNKEKPASAGPKWEKSCEWMSPWTHNFRQGIKWIRIPVYWPWARAASCSPSPAARWAVLVLGLRNFEWQRLTEFCCEAAAASKAGRTVSEYCLAMHLKGEGDCVSVPWHPKLCYIVIVLKRYYLVQWEEPVPSLACNIGREAETLAEVAAWRILWGKLLSSRFINPFPSFPSVTL